MFDAELQRDVFGTPIGACNACLVDIGAPEPGCTFSQWSSIDDPDVPPLRVRKFVPPPGACVELVQAEVIVRGSLCGLLRVENRDPTNGCLNAMQLGVQILLTPPPELSFIAPIAMPLEISETIFLGPYDLRLDYRSPPGWVPASGVTLPASEMEPPEIHCVRITETSQLAAFLHDGTGNEYLEFQHAAIDVSSTSGCAPVTFKSDPFAGVELEVRYIACTLEPVAAVADQSSVCSGESVAIDVTGNDIAPVGTVDCSTISIVEQPSHGSVTIDGCHVVYTSDGSTFFGLDTFSYVVSGDQSPACFGAPATVSVDVSRTTAVDDASTVCRGVPVDIPVLMNDSTSRGEIDPSTLVITQQPAHGSAEIVDCVVSGEATRCVRYTSAPDHLGPDALRYAVSGGPEAPCYGDALVSLTVCGTTALADQGLRVCRGGPAVLLAVGDNDSASCAAIDCAATSIVSPPAHGIARPVGCSVEFTPPSDFAGVLTFDYETCSGLAQGCCDTARVTVEVCEAVALDDTVDVCQGESVSIPITVNDSSSCGTLACSLISLSSPPLHGQASVDGCSISYTASQPGFSGVEVFSYSIEDDLGCVATASITVRVHARAIANDDRAVKVHDSLDPMLLRVLDNDVAGSGCSFAPPVQIVRQGLLGTFAPNLDGSVTYTPFPGFPEGGQDSGRYSIANQCPVPGGAPLACPAEAEILIEEAPACATQHRRRPGSLLIFPEYDNRGATITYITLTNTSCDEQSGSIVVRLNYVDAESCLKSDFTVTLSPCDTWTAITGAHHPNSQRGFVYAYCQSVNGTPVAFNHIIGSEIVFDGAGTLTYAIDAVSFRALADEGQPTDLDGDGIRDLDGLEYVEAPDRLLIPRFLGQDPIGQGNYHSELVLINLSGGKQFTTIVDFLVYNDNEEVFSAAHSFYCWNKTPLAAINGVFLQEFLVTTMHSPLEITGFPARESGWFSIDGHTASSTAETITDPAVYGFLVERVDPLCVADLPWEECGQENGDLCPMGIFGDGPAYSPNDNQ